MIDTTDNKEQKPGSWNQFQIFLGTLGLVFCVFAIVFFLANLSSIANTELKNNLSGISLGFLSVGLACVAIGISAKADKRYTEILQRLDKNVIRMLEYVDPKDKLNYPSELLNKIVAHPVATSGYADAGGRFEVTTPEISKQKAQARLDADTKKVGYVRGELYQTPDGTWAISWGGKYPT